MVLNGLIKMKTRILAAPAVEGLTRCNGQISRVSRIIHIPEGLNVSLHGLIECLLTNKLNQPIIISCSEYCRVFNSPIVNRF